MVARVQTEWTGLGGAPYLTTLYFDGVNPGEEQALADAVEAIWDASTGVFSQSLAWSTVPEVVHFTQPDTPTGAVGITSASGSGDSSGGIMPRASQGLIRLRTGQYRGAREVQGRIFIPGLTTQGVNGTTGRPSAGYQAALTAMGSDLLELGLQVASRAANVFYPVVTATAWNEFASLRSRRD